MKILDKYIAKSFLTGYAIAFCVLIGLRIIIELFVNLDEFAEIGDTEKVSILLEILRFYGVRATLYFRDFAGMITIMAAAFTFGRMIRNRELVAIMSSGVSLKRVIVPIIVLAVVSNVIYAIDQEFIIPRFAENLTRSESDLSGTSNYDIRFIDDNNGTLFFSLSFDPNDQSLYYPTILPRQKNPQRAGIWEVTGYINAKSAKYDSENQQWNFTDGIMRDQQDNERAIKSLKSDLTPKDIFIRRKIEFKSLLSFRQLFQLSKQGKKMKDQAQLYAQMHSHITDPIINIVMLLISLPILVCRDPKAMKTAILISFSVTTACFIITFLCRLFATEVFFNRVMPEFWVWLPIFLFLPLAFVEIDSMKS